MDKFHVYIYFPTGLDDKLASSNAAKEFIENFQMTLDRADCENGTVVYYGKTNKDAFFEELSLFENPELLGNIGGYNFEEALNVLLNEANVKNWENSPLNYDKSKCSYKHWIPENHQHYDGFPEILREICERGLRIIDPEIEKQILINFSKAYFVTNPIDIIKSCRDEQTKLVNIRYVSNFSEMDMWFIENRRKLLFNRTDGRHIENHHDYRNGKSPLLGGIGGRQNAENLLKTALGDKRDKKYLVTFDKTNNQYIKYEDENANLTYHGYHLVKPISHERDEEAIEKMPKRVKHLLDYRKKLDDANQNQ